MQTKEITANRKRIKLKPKLTTNDIIMVVDGRYLCYRTKYSKAGNLSYGGEETGIYYGFFKTLQSLANDFGITNTVIMWDISKIGIRKEEFSGYKNREVLLTDAEVEEKKKFEFSYNYLMTLCYMLGFASYVLPMYEADDLIALWCKEYSEAKNIIITRDEDMYQLITQNTYIYDPDSKIKKNYNWFKRTYKIEPETWIDYKAIAGCKSDTVPGIPGMGEKRTLEYLQGDPRWEAKIKQNEALYKMCHRLVILPHPSLKNFWLPYKQTRLNIDQFKEFCFEHGMVSFIEGIHNFYIFE